MRIYKNRQKSVFVAMVCLILMLFPVFAFGEGMKPGYKATSTIIVSNTSELIAAINRIVPGTTILLKDGTYTSDVAFNINGRKGDQSNPILIQAENQGKAIISGGASFQIQDSAYIVIQGLQFINNGKSAVDVRNSQYIRITRNRFALQTNPEPTKWIVLNGKDTHHTWIDHNEFGPRGDLGQMISIDGESGQVARYNVIEYNYFHDAKEQSANGGETIRIGLSGLSMSDGYNTVQHNLFVNCDSDPEVISVKSGYNRVRFNTILTSKGQVTARHGHNNIFYGNFFIGDGKKADVGGFRIYGNNHKIYNNYFEKLTKTAILVDSGSYDGGSNGYETNPNADQLREHWKVYRAEIIHNTIVDSNSGIIIGGGRPLSPEGVKVANNLVKGSIGPLYKEVIQTDTSFIGNIGYGAELNNASRKPTEIKEVNPLLTLVGGLQRLSSSSPAIHAAVGTYSFVTKDMDGQSRATNDDTQAYDVGADEYSTAPIIRKPLIPADVGPNAP